jgi:hypothetical protein
MGIVGGEANLDGFHLAKKGIWFSILKTKNHAIKILALLACQQDLQKRKAIEKQHLFTKTIHTFFYPLFKCLC